MTRFMFALFGNQRRPRMVKPSVWKWTQNWAARWWLVEANSPAEALELIDRAEGEPPTSGAAAPKGRIVDCGRHGRSAVSASAGAHALESPASTTTTTAEASAGD